MISVNEGFKIFEMFVKVWTWFFKPCIKLKITNDYEIMLINKTGGNINWTNNATVEIYSGYENQDKDMKHDFEVFVGINQKIRQKLCDDKIFYNNDKIVLEGDFILRGWMARRNDELIKTFTIHINKDRYCVFGDLKKLSELTTPLNQPKESK